MLLYEARTPGLCVLLLWLIIDGIDFFSHYEEIFIANEQETCCAKV